MPDAEQTFEQITNTVGNVDSQEFNSEVHATHDDGTPKYTGKGRLRKKRNARIQPDSHIEIDEESPSPDAAPLYAETGAIMATTITSMCTMFFGNEWRPEEQEAHAMADAWARYFEATGVTEIPPWLMLVMINGSYAAKRINQPETTSKLKSWYLKWRMRRDARANRRNDQFRQDNTSAEPSA